MKAKAVLQKMLTVGARQEEVTEALAELGELMQEKSTYKELFKKVCRADTSFYICRYLIANTDGRLDGAEKAEKHILLCEYYLEAFAIEKYSDDWMELFEQIHDNTQELTDKMDEKIGFPIKGRPDYDSLEPKFFDIFHSIATKTIEDYYAQKGEDV